MVPPRHLALRRLLAAAALLAAFSGVVEMHGGGVAHDASAGEGSVFACAAGHARSVHVERARPVDRHDCAACLHRIHSRADAAGAAAGVALAEGGVAASPITAGAPPFPPLAHAPSRGPPRA